MTFEPDRPSRDKPKLLARGRGLLWMLTGLIALAAVIAWIALGVGLYLGVESSTRLILAIAAAVATEALFWSLAAALGVSVLEARKRLWRLISRSGPK